MQKQGEQGEAGIGKKWAEDYGQRTREEGVGWGSREEDECNGKARSVDLSKAAEI